MEEFYKSIHDESYLSKLCMYGAFEKNRLVGVIATRSEGTHIALFFKEAPEKAKMIITQWKKSGQSEAQEWIIKHGMRNQR